MSDDAAHKQMELVIRADQLGINQGEEWWRDRAIMLADLMQAVLDDKDALQAAFDDLQAKLGERSHTP